MRVITLSFVGDRYIKLIDELDNFVKNKISDLEKKLTLNPSLDFSPLCTLGGKTNRVNLDEKISNLIFGNKPFKF